MKKLLLNISVYAIIVCVASCGGKVEPPNECEILSFKVGDKTWDINGLNITAIYPKGTNVN